MRDVGRTPGAIAASARNRLLRAAADVRARRGHEGTRVSELGEAAGPSNGAALVTARRDGDVLGPVRGYVQERADRPAGLVRWGQDDGGIGAAWSPHAVAHLCPALTVGTALVGPAPDRTAERMGNRP